MPWVRTVNIKGPVGLNGDQGPRGGTGTPGVPGVHGPPGKKGIAGGRGVTGGRGAIGNRGRTGGPGSRGSNGGKGLKGLTGTLSGGQADGLYARLGHTHPISQVSAGTFGAGVYTFPKGMEASGQMTIHGPVNVNNVPNGGGAIIYYYGGSLVRAASARRYKKDIETLDISDTVEQFRRMRPRNFFFTKEHIAAGASKVLQCGVIAEESLENDAFADLVWRDEDTGEVESYRYHDMVIPLVAVVQNLLDRIEALKEAG